jgi:hypothetical protein
VVLEALDRHLGKGQKITAERVTVKAGGQAIVGNVEAGGGVATVAGDVALSAERHAIALNPAPLAPGRELAIVAKTNQKTPAQ